ncbi:MAG: GAF domain-containing protein [Actinobacteria bacterium]|nr:GAF domain-containing protein [Actinomycetota bacterium]MBU1943882.1 GAF domain-containing protein [Actinomycetota bacterium]MBU2688596.1 GAF domain-containing protein [Actinomycetota bacterium]
MAFPSGKGKRLAVELLTDRRSELFALIPEDESPPSPFYGFLKQTRRKYFGSYLDSLADAVRSGDTTDFLGNETFQSYSHAKNGFLLRDVISVPACVNRAVSTLLKSLLDRGEAEGAAAFEAAILLDDLLTQSQAIRSQSFTQTRDEVINFYHAYQEEIDRFPSNLAATLDFSTLMLAAVKKCVELVGVGRCAFFTRDLLTNELHLEASNFDHERAFGNGAVKLDESLVKQLVHQGRPVMVEGYPRSMPLLSSIMKKMKTKTTLLVPLMVRERNLGVIFMDSVERPQMFTPETVNLAVRFANKAAAAMENARLHGSEQQKLKETMALLEVARLVTSTLDIDVLLSRLVQITADVCEVGKCTAYIFLEENGRFYPTATFGVFPESEWETSMGEGIQPGDLVDEEAEAILSYQVAISEPLMSPLIPDDRIEDTMTRAVVMVPVHSREHLLGMMVLFYPRERDELESEDLNLVAAIAGQAAVALENASLYEDLEMSYFSTVKALARAIEVKDPYTYGHSERVTDYAISIARRLGLSEWDKRNVKYAAALHDIGKIGIARKILNKPGALSDEEFVHVKTHPQLGDSIIEPVTFLQAPREIILHHHERFDGKGYPDGVSGEDIPLGARILAVADSFEAMMSDRPYRVALPMLEAIRELEVNAGTQFDPEVVKAFVEALLEGDIEKVSEVEEAPTRAALHRIGGITPVTPAQ